MDTLYLSYGYVAVLLMVLAGFRIVRRTAPELRGLRDLNRAVLCALGGMLLIGAHQHVPMAVISLVGNLLFFTGLLFVYRGTADILEEKPPLFSWAIALCAAAIPVIAWFVFVENKPSVRLLIHCSVVAVVLSLAARMLFLRDDSALRYAQRASAWLMTANAGVNLLWGVLLVSGDVHPNLLRPDPLEAALSYMILLLQMGTIISLAWLSLCGHRLDLQQLAQTDSLTGLLNRGAFEQVLRRELRRAQQSGGSVSVMLIDLDFFKQVNDTFGHFAGDDVLQRIAATLREGTRPSDRTGRYGGEEFVVLLRNTGLEEARQIAERLRLAISELSDLPGGIALTASIGLAVSLPNETAEDFIFRSDAALYQSKRDGRNLVTVDGESSAPVSIIG